MVDFIPLEANPEIFNKLATTLGLDTSQYCLHDILGLDDETLGYVPQPAVAMILLAPTPDDEQQAKRVAENAKRIPTDEDRVDLVYFRQRLSNHCGTIALLHALANTPSLPIADGPMKTLFERCKGLDPDSSAELLAKTDISTAHSSVSDIGQSQIPEASAPLNQHFLAFVNHKGQLLELDGSYYAPQGPISYGPIEGTLLQNVVNVVKQRIATTASINFSLMAIAPTQI